MAHELRAFCHAQGSGSGVPDAQQVLQQVQAQLQAAWPQLRGLADMPGALEMRAELLAALSRRFFARTIKMILGPQVSLPASALDPIVRHQPGRSLHVVHSFSASCCWSRHCSKFSGLYGPWLVLNCMPACAGMAAHT